VSDLHIFVFPAIIILACQSSVKCGADVTHWAGKELAEEAVKSEMVDSISVSTAGGRLLRKAVLKPHQSVCWEHPERGAENRGEIGGAICEVLLHEMAHQFADEVLGASDEHPHWPKFQRAGHLLRDNPKASEKYQPLHNRIFRESSGSENKIMLRIKELMALAQSQNHHETEAAIAKAHQLIRKYNVNLLTREKNRNFVSIVFAKNMLWLVC